MATRWKRWPSKPRSNAIKAEVARSRYFEGLNREIPALPTPTGPQFTLLPDAEEGRRRTEGGNATAWEPSVRGMNSR